MTTKPSKESFFWPAVRSTRYQQTLCPISGSDGHKCCLKCGSKLEIVYNVFGATCGGCNRKLDDPMMQAVHGCYMCEDEDCRCSRRAVVRCVDCYHGEVENRDGEWNTEPSRAIMALPGVCGGTVKHFKYVPAPSCAEPLACHAKGCLWEDPKKKEEEVEYASVTWSSRGILQCSYCGREEMPDDGCYHYFKCGENCQNLHHAMYLGGPRLGSGSSSGGLRRDRSELHEVKQEVKDDSSSSSSDEDDDEKNTASKPKSKAAAKKPKAKGKRSK